MIFGHNMSAQNVRDFCARLSAQHFFFRFTFLSMNSTGNTTVTSIDTVAEYQYLYEAAVQRCRARRAQREARRRAEESRQEDERREWRRNFIEAHRALYANTGWS